MTPAERQLLLLIADALLHSVANALPVELVHRIIAARHVLDAEAHVTTGPLETDARRNLDPDVSRRMAAEARQSALQASQGPDGIDDPHGAIRTASDAPTPSTPHDA